jgi:hypothetical protein
MATAESAELCRVAPAAVIERRVGTVVLAVPVLMIAAGAVVLAEDPQLALLTVAAVLGWTRLVGL